MNHNGYMYYICCFAFKISPVYLHCLHSNIQYYYTSYINYHKYINLIGQWVKIRTRDHIGQKSYFVK